MTDQTPETTAGEVVTYTPAPAPLARVDMRDRVTDSWTSVLADVADLATKIAQTEFVPQSLRGSVPKVAAAVLHGRELGLPPMTALSSVHVINGKAGISAEVMRSLILQAGHEFQVRESSSVRCVMQCRRRGQDEWSTFSYTMQEAQQAGDAKKNANYQSRPADMLLARCTTRMARVMFADVIHGMRSTEELEDMSEDQPVVTGEVRVQQAPARTVRRETKREQPRTTTYPVAPDAPADGSYKVGATDQGSSGPHVHVDTADEPETAEEQPARTVRRQTRREQPRGRTRPSGAGVGEAPPAGTPQGEESPSGEESTPADDRGIDPTVPSPDEATTSRGPKITPAQRTQLQMHMKRLGVEDRDERLYWTGVAAGRGDQAVESTNDLTQDEASDAIDRLGRLRDRDALEAMGAALGGDTDGE